MVDLSQNLKRLFLHVPTLIRIVIFLHTLPNLRVFRILSKDFSHDAADDHTSGGVKVRIEEDDFIVRLFFDLLRQLA
jgi:hypothetical protein